MYEHGHEQQQKGRKREEATSCRGRSELHSGSHQFLWLSGTLCYDLSWPIGPEQEVRTGDREPFSHRPSSHAARCCEFYWPEPQRSQRVRHASTDDNSTVAGIIILSPLFSLRVSSRKNPWLVKEEILRNERSEPAHEKCFYSCRSRILHCVSSLLHVCPSWADAFLWICENPNVTVCCFCSVC